MRFSHLTTTFLRKITLLASVAAFTTLPMSAGAQQRADQGDQGQIMMSQGQQQQLMQELNAKRSEIQQLNQQLASIQESTIEANPDLEQKRDDLMTLVDDKMQEAGHEPEKQRERITELREQLQSEELSESETRSVAQELRQEQGSLQQAQREILQDSEVKTERDELNREMLAAMKDQNPKTGQLIAQLQEAQQEYRTMAQQAMQSSRGSSSR